MPCISTVPLNQLATVEVEFRSGRRRQWSGLMCKLEDGRPALLTSGRNRVPFNPETCTFTVARRATAAERREVPRAVREMAK